MTTLAHSSAGTSSATPAPFLKGPWSNAQLFMLIALASWSMLFGTFLLSLGLARVRSSAWPPRGVEALDSFYPSLATAALILSSFLVHKGYKAYLARDTSNFKFFWGLSCICGLAFLVFQGLGLGRWYFGGTMVGTNLYTSAVYVLIFHGIHLVAGLGGLLYKYFKAKSATSLQLWGSFWHFLDVVWLLMFPLLMW